MCICIYIYPAKPYSRYCSRYCGIGFSSSSGLIHWLRSATSKRLSWLSEFGATFMLIVGLSWSRKLPGAH